MSTDPDWKIRLAAFRRLQYLELEYGPVLPWACINTGFTHKRATYRFASRRGIFRAKGMQGGALSIKTVAPWQKKPRYADIQIAGGFIYRLQGKNPDDYDNVWLKKAIELGAPFIYFYGVAKGAYRPLWPAYGELIPGDPLGIRVTVQPVTRLTAIDPPGGLADPHGRSLVRSYATTLAKRRLHQDAFRYLVLNAYAQRCAVCRLQLPSLLDASHIIPDHDPLGEPTVPNGIAFCKLHHSAYDSNILGVAPDYTIHITERVLSMSNGPTLEHSLKGVHETKIVPPKKKAARPDPDLLERRYIEFREAS